MIHYKVLSISADRTNCFNLLLKYPTEVLNRREGTCYTCSSWAETEILRRVARTTDDLDRAGTAATHKLFLTFD